MNELLDRVRAKILRPESGQEVGRTIECQGQVENLDSSLHLWLVIEVDDRHWPKEGEVFPDAKGEWKATIFEDGASRNVALALYVATKAGSDDIRAWLKDGQLTGDYPGLRGLPGTRRLTRSDGLRIVPTGEGALDLWKEKLDYFLREEAIAANVDQKFELQKRIEEAKARIRELEIEETPVARSKGTAEPDGGSSEEGAFFSRLVSDLVDIRIFGDEFDHRSLKPWTTEVADHLSLISRRLFSESLRPIASKLDLDRAIEGVAVKLDAIQDCLPRTLDDGGRLREKMADAATEARLLQYRVLKIAPIEPASRRKIDAAVIDSYKVVHNLSEKLATEPLSDARLSSFLETLTEVGGKLVRCYCFLEVEAGGKDEALREAGISLHLIEQNYKLNRSIDWLQREVDLASGQVKASLQRMELLEDT